MAQPDDAQSAMLALSMNLAAKEAAGERLPIDEKIIADVGLHPQSRLNGFFSPPEKSCDIVRPQ
jgi:hypothetical protein